MESSRVPNVLCVAGSDPSGGAGVQADLKTFAAFTVYGGAVITALTAQNTRGIAAIVPVPASFVALQLETVLDDLPVHALKVGMLGSGDVVQTVARVLAERRVQNVVVDPVLRSSTGATLLDPSGFETLHRLLLPLARVITPNAMEAGALLQRPAPATVAEMHDAARALRALGPECALVTGGHVDAGGDCVDVLCDEHGRIHELRAPRIGSGDRHGTGCTLSSSIAALLALGHSVHAACEGAQAYVGSAIAAAAELNAGRGVGPLRHIPAQDFNSAPVMTLGNLYLVATPRAHMSEPEFLARIKAALDGGVSVLQLRCKNTDALEYLRLADRVAPLARDANVPFIVNDRPDVASACGADGVHLGQGDLPVEWAKRVMPNAIIGRSSHEAAHATRAIAEQATYFAVGPVWETPTKPGRSAAGLSYVREISSLAPALPWFAIGGITLDNVGQVIADGATRIALVRAVLDAPDPAEAANAFVLALSRAGAQEEVACT